MIELGYVITLLVALLTGVSSLFTKKSLINLHAAQFMAGRASMDFLILIILSPFLARWPGWYAIGVVFFISALAWIAGILILKSIRHKNMSEVFPLFNLSPAVLVVFAIFFLGETLTRNQVFGILAIMFGAYFLQADKHDLLKPLKSVTNKYVIFIIFAIIIYSATATMEKSVIGDPAKGFLINSFVYLWWIKLFLSINLFAYDHFMYGSKEIKNVIKQNWKDLGTIVGIGWVSLGLMYYAIPMINISVLIPIKRSSTLFATVLGGKLFKEEHYTQRIIACIIMLSGVILMIV